MVQDLRVRTSIRKAAPHRMESIKRIYIHIGCGKTGSSALQVWLSNSVAELQAQGISYPLHKSTPLGDYKITSGNGYRLTNAIFDKRIGRYFKQWNRQLSEETLLFSSERFQLLTSEDWLYFLSFVEKYNIEIHIIAFVRDVYDITYSSYQQLIKRHTYSESFRDFALSQTNLQQLDVAERLRNIDIKVTMIHYDEILRKHQSISIPLAETIGVDPKDLPKQNNSKVNRSLTVFETQFMQIANAYYKEMYDQPCFAFSAALSDRLIKSNPEQKTEIIYDSEIEDHLANHMQIHVDMINTNFLKNSKLQICETYNKHFCEYPEALPDEFQRLIKTMIESDISEYSPSNLDKNGSPGKHFLNAMKAFRH